MSLIPRKSSALADCGESQVHANTLLHIGMLPNQTAQPSRTHTTQSPPPFFFFLCSSFCLQSPSHPVSRPKKICPFSSKSTFSWVIHIFAPCYAYIFFSSELLQHSAHHCSLLYLVPESCAGFWPSRWHVSSLRIARMTCFPGVYSVLRDSSWK